MCRAILAITLLCVLMAGVAIAQPASEFKDNQRMPQGAMGAHIRALVETVNAGTPEAVDRFVAEHTTPGFQQMAPPEMHRNAFARFKRMTGGVDFFAMRTYTPARPDSVVILRDRIYGGWQAFSLEFDPQQNGRIKMLNVMPADPPRAGQGTLSQEQIVQQVRDMVRRGCQAEVFSGTLLLAKGDQVLVEEVCGEASKGYHVKNNLDTKFNLGSMNKMFTSVAAMQLVGAGRLRLEDPISRYVDTTWLPRSITDRITVEHLLTHTSGLGSYFNRKYIESSRALYREIDDFKPLVRDDTLQFEPGSRFGYSNTGMLLLGVVVEKASGENYFEYIRKHVYQPAGMTSSDSYSLDEPIENLAEGYIPDASRASGYRNNLFDHVMRGGPAGGGYSTVRDLFRFAQALQAGRLLPSATLEKMWVDYKGGRYGYGFEVEQTPLGRKVGHSGGFPGINSTLRMFPDSGWTLAVMSNYDAGAEPLSQAVIGLLTRTAGTNLSSK